MWGPFLLYDSVFQQGSKVTEGTTELWHSRTINPRAVVEETGSHAEHNSELSPCVIRNAFTGLGRILPFLLPSSKFSSFVSPIL